MKSAFDSVDHEILFEKMRKLGITNELINSIRWMYKQTKFWVNDKEVDIGTGVIQGGVLSPTLFLIMFNDLIDKLDKEGIKVFAYADDLASIGYGEYKLSRAIRMIERWAEENKMKINRKKSGIIFHKLKKMCKNDTEYEGYPVVSKYKYLGI